MSPSKPTRATIVEFLADILRRLQLPFEQQGDTFTVTPPASDTGRMRAERMYSTLRCSTLGGSSGSSPARTIPARWR